MSGKMKDRDRWRRWINALRSGKYVQGRGVLRSTKGYCCLGVLADIDGVEWSRVEGSTAYRPTDGSIMIYRRGLPEGAEDILMTMNDGDGALGWRGNPQSFEQIADYIEENL